MQVSEQHTPYTMFLMQVMWALSFPCKSGGHCVSHAETVGIVFLMKLEGQCAPHAENVGILFFMYVKGTLCFS